MLRARNGGCARSRRGRCGGTGREERRIRGAEGGGGSGASPRLWAGYREFIVIGDRQIFRDKSEPSVLDPHTSDMLTRCILSASPFTDASVFAVPPPHYLHNNINIIISFLFSPLCNFQLVSALSPTVLGRWASPTCTPHPQPPSIGLRPSCTTISHPTSPNPQRRYLSSSQRLITHSTFETVRASESKYTSSPSSRYALPPAKTPLPATTRISVIELQRSSFLPELEPFIS